MTPLTKFTAEPMGRGRPRLGVVAREVTLLPRHWDWLATQPGGPSVAIRKLVEEARRTTGARDRNRAAQEAACHFMSSMAGNFPGFEEASRDFSRMTGAGSLNSSRRGRKTYAIMRSALRSPISILLSP